MLSKQVIDQYFTLMMRYEVNKISKYIKKVPIKATKTIELNIPEITIANARATMNIHDVVLTVTLLIN